MLNFVAAALIATALVLACKYGVSRLYQSQKQAQIQFDCKQAILKKQRLEYIK